MNVAQKFQTARPGPEMSRSDGRDDGGLQISLRALPGCWHEHPPGRLVDRDHGAIFVQNRNALAAPEFEVGCLHGARASSPAALLVHNLGTHSFIRLRNTHL